MNPHDWILFSQTLPLLDTYYLFLINSILKLSSKVAALGETTAEFIQAKGYRVDKTAKEKNILKLICEYY